MLLAHASTTSWIAPDPASLLPIVAATLLYVRAVRILAARGRRVPAIQQGSFLAGIAMLLLATQTAIDTIGEQSLLSVHMAQHMLIADLPAPLLLFGVRAPLLYFFWPRPILVAAARTRPLRSLWSWLRQPRVALATWLVTLYAWHVPVAYEAALRSPVLHAAEHVTFALGAMLAWWPLMDPTHERLEGRLWKSFYVACARLAGSVLGIALIVAPRPFYDFYGSASLQYGILPRTDQQLAGTMMMAVDFVIMTVGFIAFFMLSSREGGEADPARAALRAWEDQVARGEIEVGADAGHGPVAG